jgi:hypothetical protein
MAPHTSIERFIRQIRHLDKSFEEFYGAEIEQLRTMHKAEIESAFEAGMNNSADYFVPYMINSEAERYYAEKFKK